MKTSKTKMISKKVVPKFQPSQTTKSFRQGAPQRESYDTDEDLFAAERKYAEEWRKKYWCSACGDLACPQCGGRPLEKAQNAVDVLLAFLKKKGGWASVPDAHRELMGKRMMVMGVEIEDIIKEAGHLVEYFNDGDNIRLSKPPKPHWMQELYRRGYRHRYSEFVSGNGNHWAFIYNLSLDTLILSGSDIDWEEKRFMGRAIDGLNKVEAFIPRGMSIYEIMIPPTMMFGVVLNLSEKLWLAGCLSAASEARDLYKVNGPAAVMS